MQNTAPFLPAPPFYEQTEVTTGWAALLVAQFDEAIRQVHEATLGAIALYQERQHGR